MCILCISPDGSTVSFCYYLLVGDTAAPSGLLGRLCHTFLVSFCFLFPVLVLMSVLLSFESTTAAAISD